MYGNTGVASIHTIRCIVWIWFVWPTAGCDPATRVTVQLHDACAVATGVINMVAKSLQQVSPSDVMWIWPPQRYAPLSFAGDRWKGRFTRDCLDNCTEKTWITPRRWCKWRTCLRAQRPSKCECSSGSSESSKSSSCFHQSEFNIAWYFLYFL